MIYTVTYLKHTKVGATTDNAEFDNLTEARSFAQAKYRSKDFISLTNKNGIPVPL